MRIWPLLLFSLLFLVCPTSFSAESVGTVFFVSGEAKVQRANGAVQVLKRKSPLYNNDRLRTGDGLVQVKFRDGGFMSLQSNSELKIDKFHYEGSENGKESAIFSLLKGGLRALSGAIGHVRPARYQLRTNVATIGIRGTAYSALLCQGDCNAVNGRSIQDGLHARTSEGTIFVTNDGGMLDVPAGKSAFVPDQLTLPIFTDFNPSFAAVKPQAGAKSVARKTAAADKAPGTTAAHKGDLNTASAKLGAAEVIRGKAAVAGVGKISSEIANFDRLNNDFKAAGAASLNGVSTPSVNPGTLSPGTLGTAVSGTSLGTAASGIKGATLEGFSPGSIATPSVSRGFAPGSTLIDSTLAPSIAPSVQDTIGESISNTNTLLIDGSGLTGGGVAPSSGILSPGLPSGGFPLSPLHP